jgi:hypothetical protein
MKIYDDGIMEGMGKMNHDDIVARRTLVHDNRI